MHRFINHRFTNVNRQLIDLAPSLVQAQPMVDFADRLNSLLKEPKSTLAKISDCVGVSSQAVFKWTKGGDIEYENLRKLADCLGVNWIWLRYGAEALEDITQERGDTLSEEAKGLAEAWQDLPAAERVAMKTAVFALKKSSLLKNGP